MSSRLALDENSLVKSYLASKHKSQGATQQRNADRNPSEWEQLGNHEPHAIEGEDASITLWEYDRAGGWKKLHSFDNSSDADQHKRAAESVHPSTHYAVSNRRPTNNPIGSDPSWGAKDDFKEQDHPRGQPGNAGQFGSGSGGGGKEGNEGHHTGEKHPPSPHHSAKGGTLKLGLRAKTAINSAVSKAIHHTKHKLKEPEFVKGAIVLGLGHIIEHYVPGAFQGGGYDEGAIAPYIEHIETVAHISKAHVIEIMKDAVYGMMEAKKGIRGAHDAKEDADIPSEALEALVKVLDNLALKYQQPPVQDAKVAKEEARYTDGPTDYQPCKRCSMWRDPDICTKVEGSIAPNGHCKFWDAAKIEPAEDAEFKESDHPRGQPDNPGQFGSGGGGGKEESAGSENVGASVGSKDSNGWEKIENRTIMMGSGKEKTPVQFQFYKNPNFKKSPGTKPLYHETNAELVDSIEKTGLRAGASGDPWHNSEKELSKTDPDYYTAGNENVTLISHAKVTNRGDTGVQTNEVEPSQIEGYLIPIEVKTGSDTERKWKRAWKNLAKIDKIAKPEQYQKAMEEYRFWDNKAKQEKEGVKDSRIAKDHMAYDRGSVRNFDIDGRLHVEITNISKATVNPYLGKEIPEYEELGLQPDQVYQLLRDPKELEKAASTFNGLPLLSEHKPTSAQDHEGELVIGATGTDAVFDFPYLKNSLVIWPEYAITEVEDETKKELSCGYRYRPDMTPGIFQGMKYDGVMRDIIGNHVALVKEGRAGPDVIVGDSRMKQKPKMSRQAAVAIGFLSSVIRPALAADAKLDLRPIFTGVTAKNFKEKKKAIGDALTKSLKGKLATDATIGEVAELLDMIEAHGVEPGPAPGGGMEGGQEDMDALPKSVEPAMEKAAEPVESAPMAEPGAEPGAPGEEENNEMEEGESDPAAKVEALLKGKVDDATLAQVCELIRGAPAGAHDQLEEDANSDKGTGTGKGSPGGSKEGAAEGQAADKDEEAEDEEKDDDEKKATDKKGAMDDPPPFKGMPKPGGKMVTQDAMNAAIKAATEAATKNALTRQRDIREAERAVRPWVGDIAIACDSAAGVYKTALKMLGVKELDSIDPSAFRTILELHPMAGVRQKAEQSEIAMDEASTSSYADRFPDASRIGIL